MAPLSSEFAPSLSPPRGVSQTGSSRAGRWVCHLLCVVALMWTALVNGQPFFFPDTTSYIRSADLAVFLASDHRLSTAWTARYADGLTPKTNADAQPQAEPTPKQPTQAQPQTAHSVGNDVSSGNIMAGRRKQFEGCRADAAAGARQEDVHGTSYPPHEFVGRGTIEQRFDGGGVLSACG